MTMMSRQPTTCRAKRWRAEVAADVGKAAQALKSGKIVAFPTETVYGLGANATCASAVAEVFKAKGRPADNPLIVHVAEKASLERLKLTSLPLGRVADAVTTAFWPGPLTVVLPLRRDAALSELVTAGLCTVGIRVPSHPVACSLLKAAGIAVAAPSANRSGRPSPTTEAHVAEDLDDRIYGILSDLPRPSDARDEDATAQFGIESTVVDCTIDESPVILRPGAISREDLERVSGASFAVHDAFTNRHACASENKAGSGNARANAEDAVPKAPGMKYRHYAPRAPVLLRQADALYDEIKAQLEILEPPNIVGVLADEETCADLRQVYDGRVRCVPCGRRGDSLSVAQELYAGLRAFDGEGPLAIPRPGAAVIVALALADSGDGIAAAVMNRLRKAASAPSGGSLC